MAGVVNSDEVRRLVKQMSPSLTDQVEDQISAWLLDYACYSAIQQFRTTGTVDEDSNRNFTQGILFRSVPAATNPHPKVRVLLLLCHVADGEDPSANYNDDSCITVLESALALVMALGKQYPNGPGMKQLDVKIKTQAVLTFIRAGDLTGAAQVFNRLWGSEPSSEKSACSQLIKRVQDVVQGKAQAQPLLDEYPYASLKDAICDFVQNIQDQLPIPFLIQAALANCKHRADGTNGRDTGQNRNNNASRADEVLLSGLVLSDVLEELNLDRLHGRPLALSHKQGKNLEKKIVEARSKVFQGDLSYDKFDEDLMAFAESSRKAVETNKSTAPTSRTSRQPSGRTQKRADDSLDTDEDEPAEKLSRPPLPKLRRNKGRADRHQPVPSTSNGHADKASLSSADDENDLVNNTSRLTSTPSKKNKNWSTLSINLTPEKSVGRRLKWTPGQEATLYQQVKKYGVGQWSDIRDTGLFAQRTNVNLKDKWRQMQGSGRAEELAKLFGSVDPTGR